MPVKDDLYPEQKVIFDKAVAFASAKHVNKPYLVIKV